MEKRSTETYRGEVGSLMHITRIRQNREEGRDRAKETRKQKKKKKKKKGKKK
jgi:hypothetical protein